MRTYGLREVFGAQFPQCSEIDHLLALRGLLFFFRGKPGLSLESARRLSFAIDEVSAHLTSLGLDLRDKSRVAPRELFEFYRDTISAQWRWLQSLKTLT